jgi:hypothetical protein
VERVLIDINADYGNRTLCCRSHGMLLILAPLASLSLARQEHGRTIPIIGHRPKGAGAPRFTADSMDSHQTASSALWFAMGLALLTKIM